MQQCEDNIMSSCSRMEVVGQFNFYEKMYPLRAGEQGKVIGVGVNMCVCVCVCVCKKIAIA